MKAVLLPLLKLTRGGSAELASVVEASRLGRSEALRRLKEAERMGLLEIKGEKIRVDYRKRLTMAVEALRFGADPEKVSRLLDWREFERLSSSILEQNGYEAFLHLVFRDGETGRRHEMDVLGVKEFLILCLDCKSWRRGWYKSRVSLAAKKQLERSEALGRELPSLARKLKLSRGEYKILPLVLTLADVPYRILEGSLVVPILRFKAFLYELPGALYGPLAPPITARV